MSRDDAERLAWSMGNDARAVAEHAAEFASVRSELEAVRDVLDRVLTKLDRLAGAPITKLAL